MKKFEKRLLSVLLCFVLLCGVLPAGMITAAADTDASTFGTSSGIRLVPAQDPYNADLDAEFNPTDISENGFTLRYDGRLIYGIASFATLITDQCTTPKKQVANLIIPTSNVDRILSFDYEPSMEMGGFDTNNQVIGITVGDYEYNAPDDYNYKGIFDDYDVNKIDIMAGHMEIDVPANEFVRVQFEVFKSVGAASLTVSNVTIVEKPSELGNVTVVPMGEGTGRILTEKTSSSVTLTAQPDEGSVFIAYLNTQGIVLSADEVCTIKPTSDQTVKALFGKASAEQNFRIGRFDGGYCFTDTLDEALAMTRYFKDKTIIVNSSQVELTGRYTIPADVTLVVPEAPESGSGDCVLYTNDPHIVTSKAATGVYSRLVLDTDASLEVKGTLYVGGSMYVKGGDSHAMTGRYGVLYLKNGSSVNHTDGSRQYAWGFVSGSGVVNALSGSTAYEMLQIGDWRQGTATLLTILGSAFPFEQFYVQNIESKIVFRPGASEMVLGLGSLAGIAVPVCLPFIGEANSSLFSVMNGYIDKYVGLDWNDSTYMAKADGSADAAIQDKKLHIDISGSAKVTHFPLISIFGADSEFVSAISQSSSGSGSMDMVSMFSMLDTNFLSLPISNMSINLGPDSYLSSNQSMTVLPGSDITIGERSLFDLNGSIAAIDSEAWCKSSVEGVRYHFTGKSGENIVPLQHSPSYTDTRTSDSLADSDTAPNIVIDGTLHVNDGIEMNLGILYKIAMGDSDFVSAILDSGLVDVDAISQEVIAQYDLQTTPQDEIEQAVQEAVQQEITNLIMGFVPYFLGKVPYTEEVIEALDMIDMFDDRLELSHYSFTTSDLTLKDGQNAIYEDTIKSSVISNGAGTLIIDHPVQQKVHPLIAIDRYTDVELNLNDLSALIDVVNSHIFAGLYTELAWLKNSDNSYTKSFDLIYPDPDDEEYCGIGIRYNMFVYQNGSWVPQLEAIDWDYETFEVYDWDQPYLTYQITWLDADGALIEDTEVFEGETPTHMIPEKADDSEYTYTFAGWKRMSDDSAPAPADGDATYKATFTSAKKSCTVTFYDSDGTLLDTQSVAIGCTPDGPAVNYVTGTGKNAEIFTGWKSGETLYSEYELPVVTSDMSFTATYEESYLRQTLEDQSQILYNLYLNLTDEEAARASVHFSFVNENVTQYRAGLQLEKTVSGYKAKLPLAPAELTFDLDITLSIDGADVHYDMEAADYADILFGTDDTVQDGNYYLAGIIRGENCWPDNVNAGNKFTVNPANSSEYMLQFVKLNAGDSIKVVQKHSGGYTYFPDKWDNVVTDPKGIDTTGYYDIYFKPGYDGYGADWYYQTIYITRHQEPAYGATQRSVTSALMNYGTKAQEYFSIAGKLGINYNTADLANDHVNGNVYSYDNALPTPAASTMKDMNLSGCGLKYYGSTFILNSGTVMRHYFRIQNSSAELPTQATFSVAGKADVFAEAQYDGNFIYFDYVAEGGSGIPGPELGLTVTCTINGVSGEYSFMNYAKTAIAQAGKDGATDASVKLGELVTAMYWYYVESSAYFA